MKMERWQVIFEVTLDIQKDESIVGALQRAKKAMNKIQGKEIAHYHILQQPRIVQEFD